MSVPPLAARLPLLLAGLLSAPAQALHVFEQDAPTGDYWAGRNGDPLRTGASPHTAPSQLEGGPTWRWTEKNDGLIRATPLIDKDLNIYVAAVSGRVFKVTPEGEIPWTQYFNTSVPSQPALMDGMLYAGTDDGRVAALNTTTGKTVWETKVAQSSSPDTWSVTAAEGVVVTAARNFFASHLEANNELVGLDAKTGKKLWQRGVEDQIVSVVTAVKDGTLVFATSKGRGYRLRLADGLIVWKTDIPPDAGTSAGGAVIGPNGVVYVTSNQVTSEFGKKIGMAAAMFPVQTGLVSAYNFDDGKLLWRTELPMQVNNAAAVGSLTAGGHLSLAVGTGMSPNPPQEVKTNPPLPSSKPGRVYTLDAKTGKLGWTFDMPDWSDRGAVAAGDTLSHVCMPAAFSNVAIGGDGTLYVGFMSGRLYALRDKDGDGRIEPATEASSYDFKDAFQGSPAVAPGLLVATPCNGLAVFDGRPKRA